MANEGSYAHALPGGSMARMNPEPWLQRYQTPDAVARGSGIGDYVTLSDAAQTLKDNAPYIGGALLLGWYLWKRFS